MFGNVQDNDDIWIVFVVVSLAGTRSQGRQGRGDIRRHVRHVQPNIHPSFIVKIILPLIPQFSYHFTTYELFVRRYYCISPILKRNKKILSRRMPKMNILNWYWNCTMRKYQLCPTKRHAVAWIQSFLEPVCGQRGVRDPAHPTLGKRVSWNPADMGKTREEVEENPFQTWWRRISSQQSEKFVVINSG
jgi:hypothetical protein